jgi:hypothetical protein
MGNFVNKPWIFCTPIPIVLEFTSPRKENRVSSKKKALIVDPLFRHVQTEEISYKNLSRGLAGRSRGRRFAVKQEEIHLVQYVN